MESCELALEMERDDIDIPLRTVDEEIIEMLEEGRCTRRHLAAELGYTGEYIYQRVTRLMEHGIVTKIHDGFYELTTDGGTVQVAPDVDTQNAPVTPHTANNESLDDVVVPDSVPDRLDIDEVRATIRAALDVVAAEGPVEREAITNAIAESHPLGYDSHRVKGSWWRKIVKPGLEENGCRYVNGAGWSKKQTQ